MPDNIERTRSLSDTSYFTVYCSMWISVSKFIRPCIDNNIRYNEILKIIEQPLHDVMYSSVYVNVHNKLTRLVTNERLKRYADKTLIQAIRNGASWLKTAPRPAIDLSVKHGVDDKNYFKINITVRSNVWGTVGSSVWQNAKRLIERRLSEI